MFHEHLSSHLDTAAPGLGADAGTQNALIPSEPLNPAPAVTSPLFSLQHILIIGGVAALIYFILSKQARKPTKD